MKTRHRKRVVRVVNVTYEPRARSQEEQLSPLSIVGGFLLFVAIVLLIGSLGYIFLDGLTAEYERNSETIFQAPFEDIPFEETPIQQEERKVYEV